MPEPPPISDFLTPTTIHTTELCCFERTRGRGSLQRIDSALQPYLLHRATMPVTERIAALARIISECRRWLNDKGTEAKSTTVTRKPHVETLLRETTLWYKYYRYETNKTLTEIVGVNAHAVGAKVKYSVEPPLAGESAQRSPTAACLRPGHQPGAGFGCGGGSPWRRLLQPRGCVPPAAGAREYLQSRGGFPPEPERRGRQSRGCVQRIEPLKAAYWRIRAAY